MQLSHIFTALLLCAHGAVANDYKMNQYKDYDCKEPSYAHSGPAIFCGDIDYATHSLYIYPHDQNYVQFWSGPLCLGEILYTIPVDKYGQCYKLQGHEYSMRYV
ncbi:hypothetical protein M422DRAFT_36375 [Sphaerobolus stellatus SS14]|uniref:Uncharacterized protein n=1 Tax=Sphaerobolus stellatus (strain SS14) TaxID=990650 RepID=A0A0C9V0N2_SPHS4|nr:hypothetical protein M422DRAFT_36375 [Sphaerobolus stellatus SS14]